MGWMTDQCRVTAFRGTGTGTDATSGQWKAGQWSVQHLKFEQVAWRLLVDSGQGGPLGTLSTTERHWSSHWTQELDTG